MEECILWWVIYLTKFLVSSLLCSQIVWEPILAVIHYSLNISCEWCCMCSLSSSSPPRKYSKSKPCDRCVQSASQDLSISQETQIFCACLFCCWLLGPFFCAWTLGMATLPLRLRSHSHSYLIYSNSFPAAALSLARQTGNPLLHFLNCMKAAKGPDVTCHWFLSRAKQRAGENCWWNVHLFLSKAISPVA